MEQNSSGDDVSGVAVGFHCGTRTYALLAIVEAGYAATRTDANRRKHNRYGHGAKQGYIADLIAYTKTQKAFPDLVAQWKRIGDFSFNAGQLTKIIYHTGFAAYTFRKNEIGANLSRDIRDLIKPWSAQVQVHAQDFDREQLRIIRQACGRLQIPCPVACPTDLAAKPKAGQYKLG